MKSQTTTLVNLAGKIGIAITRISMVGYVEIDGIKYEAIAKYFPITKNQVVKVIGQQFGQLEIMAFG